MKTITSRLSTEFNMKKALCVCLAWILVLALLLGMVGCSSTTKVVQIIDRSSHTTYNPENLLVPWIFKTMPIVSDGNISLGYSKDNGGYVYCVNGYEEYERTFTFFSGTITEKNHVNIIMKAEFTFTENELKVGNSIEVLVNFYNSDTHSSAPIASTEVYITIEKAYAYRVAFNHIATTTVSSGYISYYGSRDHFKSTAILFAADCIEAFDNFLIANDIRAFYRK